MFISPIPDPLAVGVDAFSVDWNRWTLVYLFPPVRMILKALALLETFRGRALFVTPDWPNQTWFPLIQSKAKSCLVLANPSLSQLVGTTRFYNTSKAYHRLLCWSL